MKTLFILNVYLAVALIAFAIALFRMNRRLKKAEKKNLVYSALAKRVPIDQFFKTVNLLNFIDDEIVLVFQQYLKLAMLKMNNTKTILRLLDDINGSKYPDILMEALAKVAADDEGFGLALGMRVHDVDERAKIEAFLSHLPSEKRKNQYRFALGIVEQDYNERLIDYPSEYRKPIEDVMKQFQAKIEML